MPTGVVGKHCGVAGMWGQPNAGPGGVVGVNVGGAWGPVWGGGKRRNTTPACGWHHRVGSKACGKCPAYRMCGSTVCVGCNVPVNQTSGVGSGETA